MQLWEPKHDCVAFSLSLPHLVAGVDGVSGGDDTCRACLNFWKLYFKNI